ncbi:GNAT family N-acetyltransferase [Maribacter sp. 2-571]|uniref:GNAT family N-acetyltransferase n=1 Tax=Maribacter sp. 2-571 TaxID=3417569 RepID=UPI003D331D8D
MELLLDGESTERLLFRKVTLSHFDAWLPFHRDRRTSEFWSGLPKDPIKACTDDLERTLYRYENGLGGKQALILRDTEQLVGLAGLLIQEVAGKREIEIAYSLLPEFWGKGLATEAALQCKEVAIERQLAPSLISIIQIHNLPSQKVATAVGMQQRGTTQYHNNPVHIYRIAL